MRSLSWAKEGGVIGEKKGRGQQDALLHCTLAPGSDALKWAPKIKCEISFVSFI